MRMDRISLPVSSLHDALTLVRPKNTDASDSPLLTLGAHEQLILVVSGGCPAELGTLSVESKSDLVDAARHSVECSPESYRSFLDQHGRFSCMYDLSPRREVIDPSIISLEVVDGDFVHVIDANVLSRKDDGVSQSALQANTLREELRRGVTFTIYLIRDAPLGDSVLGRDGGDLQPPGSVLSLSLYEMRQRFNGFRRAIESLSNDGNVASQGLMSIVRISDSQWDVRRLVELQREQPLHEGPSPIAAPLILAQERSLWHFLFQIDSDMKLLANALSAPFGHKRPFSIELATQPLVLATAKVPTNVHALSQPKSPFVQADNPRDILVIARRDPPPSGIRDLVAVNGPLIRSLQQSAEVAMSHTPWSQQFACAMQQLGFQDTPEDSNCARRFLEMMLKQSNQTVAKARDRLSSPPLSSLTSYWPREIRGFFELLGFCPKLMSEKCSVRPHIPGAIRIAAKGYLEQLVHECTAEPSVGGVGGDLQRITEDLRIIAAEQMAEHEYCRSCLEEKVPSLPSVPLLFVEVLRFLEFPPFRGTSGQVPMAPRVRQLAVDFLKQRIQICPMETFEDTTRRRSLELLSGSWVTRSTEPWSPDVRAFLRMLEFFTEDEYNRLEAAAARQEINLLVDPSMRNRARIYLEYRADGKNPKLEIAKQLLREPALKQPGRQVTTDVAWMLAATGCPGTSREGTVLDLGGRQTIVRYLSRLVEVHESNPKLTLFKELLNSSMFTTPTSFWPLELRSALVNEGFFVEQLSVPICRMLNIPMYIRNGCRRCVEVWVRDKLKPIAEEFPDAMQVFPVNVKHLVADSVPSLEEESDYAMTRWALSDQTAAEKDFLREETMGGLQAASSYHVALGDVEPLATPATQNGDEPRGEAGIPSGTHEQRPATTVSLLTLSCGVVKSTAQPDYNDETVRNSIAAGSGASSSSANPPTSNSNNPVDLNEYMAKSTFGQHQFTQNSVRSVVSGALVHGAASHERILGKSVRGLGLIGRTWAILPAQELSSEHGGIHGIDWTPLVLGSTSVACSTTLDTLITVGVFNEKASSPTATTELRDGAEKGSEMSADASNETSAAPPGFGSLQGTSSLLLPSIDLAARDSGRPDSSRFPNPYEAAATSVHSNPFFAHAAPMSRGAATRPIGLRAAASSSAALRSRLAVRTAATSTKPVNPFDDVPPQYATSFSPVPVPRPSTPVAKVAGSLPDSDEDILNMIRAAEQHASGPKTAQQRIPERETAQQRIAERERLRQERIRACRLAKEANKSDDAPPARSGASSNNPFASGPAKVLSFDDVPIAVTNVRAPPRNPFDGSDCKPRTFEDRPLPVSNLRGLQVNPGLDSNNASVTTRRVPAKGLDDIFCRDKKVENVDGPLKSRPFLSPSHSNDTGISHNPNKKLAFDDALMKEEIDVFGNPRTPSALPGRRREREILPASPAPLLGVTTARRRLEQTNSIGRFGQSSTMQRMSFDDEPIIPPANRLHEPVREINNGVRSTGPRANIATDDKIPVTICVPSTRPPLSGTSQSAASRQTTNERLAAAAARRAQLNGQSDPIAADVVSPYAATANMKGPNIEIFAPPTRRVFQSQARNPFGTSIDVNTPPPPAALSNSQFRATVQEENHAKQALREIEEERIREKQETELQRRQRLEKLTQQRLYSAAPREDRPSLGRLAKSFASNGSPRQPNELKLVGEVGLTMRTVVESVLRAVVDKSFADNQEGISHAIHFATASVSVLVAPLPPLASGELESEPCAILVIPVTEFHSLPGATSDVSTPLKLLIRVPLISDLLQLLSKQKLLSLDALQETIRRAPRRHNSLLLKFSDRWRIRRHLLHHSWTHVSRNFTSESTVLEVLVDPLVCEARYRAIALILAQFNKQQLRIRSRLETQKYRQEKMQQFGIRDARDSLNPRAQSHSVLQPTYFTVAMESTADLSPAPFDRVVPIAVHGSEGSLRPVSPEEAQLLLRKQRAYMNMRHPLCYPQLLSQVVTESRFFVVNGTNQINSQVDSILHVGLRGVADMGNCFTSSATLVKYALCLVWIYVSLVPSHAIPLVLACAFLWCLRKVVAVVSTDGPTALIFLPFAASRVLKRRSNLRHAEEVAVAQFQRHMSAFVSVGTLSSRLQRAISGASLLLLLASMLVIGLALLAWMIAVDLSTSPTDSASLTEQEAYLGIPFHVDDANGSASFWYPTGASPSEVLCIFGVFALFVPYGISPLQWLLRGLWLSLLRDPALEQMPL